MLINSLEIMETIVKNNKSLSWDGWTVVHRTKSPTAWSNQDGAFIDGVWHILKRYELSEQGWDLPDKLATQNGSK